MDTVWMDPDEPTDIEGLVGVGIGPPRPMPGSPPTIAPPVFVGDEGVDRSHEDVVIETNAQGDAILTGTREPVRGLTRPVEQTSELKARDEHEMKLQYVLVRFLGYGFILIVVAYATGTALGWYTDTAADSFFQTTMASLLAAAGTIIGFLFGQNKRQAPPPPPPAVRPDIRES